MLNPLEQFMNAGRANMQASMNFTNLTMKSLEGATRLSKQQFDVATTMIEGSAEALKAVAANGSNPGAALDAYAKCCEKQSQKVVALWREYLETSAETQTEVARLLAENLQNVNKSVTDNLASLSQSAGETVKRSQRARS